MRIFFEGAHYTSDQMTNIEPWMYSNIRDGVSFNYLGYYLPQGNSEPVVILPKVFLDDSGNFIGKEPSYFVDIQETLKMIENNEGDLELPEGIDAKALKETVMGISTWVYRSIAHYIERVEESNIAEESNIQNVISQREEGTSATYLDTILQLFRFAKEHKNLFAFITNLTHQHRNKIVWNKTIRKSLPLMQDGTPIYMDLYSKKKDLDFDEELLKLFFSTLKYLNHAYSFDYDCVFHFDTYNPSQIEQMLESGRGSRLLRSIRYKYFSDDMVNLWNILFAYYDKAEKVKSHRNSEELLLVRNYNLVFEDMIDQLIGDDIPLKNQEDGKIIDHIYKERDLHNSSNYIYYIADSKYYLNKNELSGESIYKQYTYAKNVIQYNINLFNDRRVDASLGLRYRDELTEGYNITPNFFIRGKIKSEDVNNTKDERLERIGKDNGDGFRKNMHFPNRLFDRDTLPTQEYTINFLFVLATYVSNSKNDSYKEAIRQTFKKDLTTVLNEKYNFYTLTTQSGHSLEEEVETWFKRLNGKIYRLSENDSQIVLALEKNKDSSIRKDSLDLLWTLKKDSNFCGFTRFNLGSKVPLELPIHSDPLPNDDEFWGQIAADLQEVYQRNSPEQAYKSQDIYDFLDEEEKHKYDQWDFSLNKWF